MGLLLLLLLLLSAGCAAMAADDASKSSLVYENTFEKAELKKVPDDMMVMEGGWSVVEEGANRFIELPGAPLETFGVLFGPTESHGIGVSARVFGTGKGRRFPTFAVGLNGVGGYRLQVSPAKKLIELYRGDELLKSAPFQWEQGTWTVLRLQSRKVKDGEFAIEGKAWKHGAAEPKEWAISHTDAAEVPAGRASIWGAPYSGTPIGFDDLNVMKAG
jgi:hypothetical protein